MRRRPRAPAAVLACLAAAAALLPTAGSREHTGVLHRHPEVSGSWSFEVVVARFDEPLDWLARVPESYHVTVYNKGGAKHPVPPPPDGRHWSVVELQNVGREGHTFAEHLVRRYDSLAGYTIFTQGDPFTHNEHYLELLNSPSLLSAVQTMSKVYKRGLTPDDVIAKGSRHPWYRSARFSLFTLNDVNFHEEGTVPMQREYREAYGLPQGTNLIHHLFSEIGLPHWIPRDQEVGGFAFGAQVGFERSRALQHPKRVYELLRKASTEALVINYVIERTWVMLFGGAHYRDI